MRRDWKRTQPTSLVHALRLCKDHALEKKNLSVERIADLMGVTTDSLYKWLSNGRMPANLIPAYEHICQIGFVSRWLAVSDGKVVIDIPTGRAATALDVHQLQGTLNSAVGSILDFAAGKADADATLAAINAGLAGLAWHRANVEKHLQPELEFGGAE